MIWKCYAGGEEFTTDDPLIKAQWVSDGHHVVPVGVESAQDLVQRMQQKCVDLGAYWRASDAHGVTLNKEQAVNLLQDILGVEVEITVEPQQAPFVGAVQPAQAVGHLVQSAQMPPNFKPWSPTC